MKGEFCVNLYWSFRSPYSYLLQKLNFTT